MYRPEQFKGWSSVLDGSDPDYKAYIQEYSAARAKYQESHDASDYKAMAEVREKYGITKEAEKPLYTILSMMDNKAHQDGNVVCKISAKEFEAMLNTGHWNELIAKIKDIADKDVINEASKGRYPLLGELFKCNHKDSALAMTAFGLYQDKYGYSLKVNPDKLQYSNYEFFDKALQNIRLSQQISENVASQLDMNSENSQNVYLKR